MCHKIDISVIIPTYGMPTLLESSIKSVIGQSFKDFELIIVDDNNPGTANRVETEKILAKYSNDSRVIYIKHDRNKNGAAARNTGLKFAKGKYISFLDSDDEYTPDRLIKCFKVMENASPNIAAVYSGCEFKRQGNTYQRYTDVKQGNYLVETLACTFRLGTGSNIFVRKSVLDELNGFDEAFLRQQDYEFFVRLFLKYSIEAIPEILVIKNNENFNLPDTQKIIDIREQYLDKYRSIIESLSESDQNTIYYGNYLNIAVNAMLKHNIKYANEYYRKAQCYGRLSPKEYVKRCVLYVRYLFKI